MENFKLDRTAFKAQTAEETADHASHYASLSAEERMRIAAYLNSIAFNYPLDKPPKLDRTLFKARSLSDDVTN